MLDPALPRQLAEHSDAILRVAIRPLGSLTSPNHRRVQNRLLVLSIMAL